MIRTIPDFLALLTNAEELTERRGFSRAVQLANERFGVPMGTIAGGDHGTARTAQRWKTGKSLPDAWERLRALDRIRKHLSMRTS